LRSSPQIAEGVGPHGGRMNVTVIGAGKMGLPLACQLAARGATVTACDINPAIVEAINHGSMPFAEPGVAALLTEAHKSGSISATTDVGLAVRGSDVTIVIIPVLLTAQKTADTRGIEAVTRQIAASLRPGMMISYETTLPVGTTRKVLCPILETSGLRAGHDFDVVFSPERVKSQSVLKHLTSVPKIVGGVSSASARRGADFYRQYLAPVINVESLEAAEFAKLAGMVYRDVNIALANELASYAEMMGIDFSAVRQAANTDGESSLLIPGIGVGGHCAPVYPYFLLQHAESPQKEYPLTSAARATNDLQTARMLERAGRLGARLAGGELLILGLGFRPSVKEHTFSPAFLLKKAAEECGAQAFLHDPLYTDIEIADFGFKPWDWFSTRMPEMVALNTAHPEYRNPNFVSWHKRGARHVIDGRNFWSAESVTAAGLFYIAPGVPDQVPDVALASVEQISHEAPLEQEEFAA
jgi:nucleotide sugar dehydrogenase